MSSSISLCSIFNETKGELASSFSGLLLPKDINEVQTQITKYLNKVCGEDNEYRQNLTQSEDYILQAALSMLNAQRDIVSAISHTPKIETKIIGNNTREAQYGKSSSSLFINATPPINSLLGAGGGALIGKWVFGGWGAVFGSIAGTALVLYLAQHKQSISVTSPKQISVSQNPEVEAKIVDCPVDVESLLGVIGQLCEGLDNLISTFRAQIKRVVDKYESQEKPTVEREYRVLIEGIQSLLGYKRGHNQNDEKYLSKLQTRIEDLAELLDNYDLQAVDYIDDNAQWFDAIESEKATEVKLVSPAIVKNGDLVIKGKVFIPKI